MNRRQTRLLFFGFVLGASAVAMGTASCSNDSKGNGLEPDGGLGGNASASASTGDGGGITPPPPCDETCSNDLKRVVNCNGETIKECPSEQGCSTKGGAKCVDDPCVAAKESKSSYGCDYWAIKTGLEQAALGACFTAFVANTWSTPVKINVEYKGMQLPVQDFAFIPKGQGGSITYEPYDVGMGLPVGEVAILFLARNDAGFVPDCPKEKAINTEVGVDGTGIGDAFHITTDRPVVSYQLLPYGGGSSAFTSATLLLPTSAWGVNYIAVSAYPEGKALIPNGKPVLDILAYEPDTEVKILPNTDIIGGNGVAAATKDTVTSYMLQPGQFLQIVQPNELTGSPIESTKPIGVWGGSTCLYVPTDKAACDSAQQQIPPVNALGSSYAAVRYRGRGGMDEEVPWRIVGAAASTTLTWTPEAPPGAPTSITLGGVYEFKSKGPFVVTSQDVDHPFYLSAYMTAGTAFNNEGDPEWVNIIPTDQYLDHYVMFADPTYSETNLVVVRRKSGVDGKFRDVNLDCFGPLDGWMDVGDYQYTRKDLVTGNFMNVGECSNGRHEISSEAPFGVTVWGWGTKAAVPTTQLVSYAYPAGAGVQPLNSVFIPVIPD